MAPMNGMNSKTASRGFTMTELLMVMAVVGILAGIGIPSFKYVTTSNRIAAEINGALGDMQFARSEAVKQGLPVTVCASTDGATCSGGDNWHLGWIVFLDSNGDHVVNNGEQILRVQNAFSATGSTDTFIPGNGTFSYIVFNREGYASTNAVAVVTVKLHDANATSQWARCLAITPVGMLNTQRAGTGNCT
jgi:type IV fimbrial biogenesis protein FimT